ncbi:MAG: hypothetical protein Q4Q06_03950, partial [Bacteroidota bacterium]|nr:hypothetical protein [Bacteroidota bacterium]
MTQEKKIYLQHSFRYGSIIGFVSFLYYLIGYYTGLEKKTFVFDNLYFFISMAMLIVMMVKYRRMQSTRVKFSRYVAMGFVASVVIAFFLSAYLFIRIMVLDTYMIYQIISIVEQTLQDYEFPALSTANINVFKISYVFANFLVNIFNNMIYVLLISAFMVFNSRI